MLKAIRIKVRGAGEIEVYPVVAGKKGASLRMTHKKQVAKTAGEAVSLLMRLIRPDEG